MADFARSVVRAASPETPGRAKALLYASAKLGAYAASIGLELDAAVVLGPSVIERFILTKGRALSPATRRTVRSNLRFVARRVLSEGPPAPARLSRERAKAPYGAAQIEAYLALADAQPTQSRRMRLSGLIALGAGAGLMGADLRGVKGTDVIIRSGGTVVEVTGRRARVVPVRAPLCGRLRAAAAFAGAGLVTGGFSASRRNVTAGLVASVAGGVDLATLDTGRLRATWLCECASAIGLRAFMDAAGITCSQRLGDLVATLGVASEPQAVALLGTER